MTDVVDHADQNGPVGNGLRRAPSRANAFARAAVVAAALFLVPAPGQSAVTEFVVPSGPLITLQDGRTIDGHIVSIDQTNIVIQMNDGSTETLPRSTVASVAFETVTGRELVGELVGWTSGVYQIATAEAAIKVFSTMPQLAAPPVPVIAASTDDTPNETAEAVAEPAETAETVETTETDSSPAVAAATVDETATGGDAAVGVVDTQNAAATPTSDLSIEVSVENSKENGPPVAFNIELSSPSENSVVLIYATIDGTAINGEDYEANRGVVVIKPGELIARIEAPVIDDGEVEKQEHLQLFLTVDPTVAVVKNRQIIATIDDDDQG